MKAKELVSATYEAFDEETRVSSNRRNLMVVLRGFAHIILLCTLINFSLFAYQWKSSQVLSRLASWIEKTEVGVESWRWSSITPESNLTWHTCYEKYDCARLDVPLDWLDPSDDLRISLAIIRYNATDKANYKGPVFINPGGPGGSGVWFVKWLAPYYQTVVGKNHDIISFDPRGVGASTPTINCWDSGENARIWQMKNIDVIDAHSSSLSNAYAYAFAQSKQCETMLAGGADNIATKSAESRVMEAGLGRFVTTASVARDMLEIMEKAGQDKLKYWGFSYGTVLGMSFASMFPDRIDRMVNDGNVDAEQLSSGRGTHFVHDTDKVLKAFFHFCHLAGSQDCAFHSSTPEKIENRLDSLLEKLRHNPIVVLAPKLSGKRPEIITFSGLRRMIASSLYRPLSMFPVLAEVLAQLEVGNGGPFIELSGQGSGDPFLCESDPGPSPELPEVEGSADASNAILCSDGGLLTDTITEFGEYVAELSNISKSAGATMSEMRLACVGYTVQGKYRFTGPFEGNTSFPILFVANIADNVTPMKSALQNIRGFKGSAILSLNIYGHTSLAAPSRCGAKYIQAYFQDGTLPKLGYVCDADIIPFEKFNVTSQHEVMSEDQELDYALLKLMHAPIVGF